MDDTSFVDGLIKDAGNTAEKPGAAAPAAQAPQKKTAPNPADQGAGDAGAQAGAEHFDDGEYADEEEGGEEFDHTKVDPARKAKWPKKYANAMSRRDKENARLKSELSAYQTRLAALGGTGEAQQPQGAAKPGAAQQPGQGAQQPNAPAKTAEMWELESKKPDLNTFKDWGEYQEKLLEWKMEVRDLQAKEKASAQKSAPAEVTITPEQQAAIVQNENRIVQQAKEVIAKNPEVFQLMQQNADLIDSLPQPIVNVIGSLQNPVVAMMELVSHPGALEALRYLTPAQAAQVLFNAQAQGLAKLGGSQDEGDEGEDGDGTQGGQGNPAEVKKVSGAPQPIKAAKNSPSGKRQLHQMNADEILKELDIR